MSPLAIGGPVAPRPRLLVCALATLLAAAGCAKAPALAPAGARPDAAPTRVLARELDELIVASRDAAPPVIAGATPKAHFAFAGTHYHLLSVARPGLKDRLLAALRQRLGAERVGPNRGWLAREAPAEPGEAPDDEFYALQYGLVAKQLPAAWRTSRGAGVTVAVVDTGVDRAHPDLLGRVDAGPDLVNDDDDPQDERGHGTHVAGIIGARANNGIGVAGVAPDCRLLAVKVLDGAGRGDAYLTARGVAAAVERGAKVLNLSLGGSAIDSALRGFYADVVKAGALVVAAAGNDGEAVGFPAALPGVLAVGATDEAGALAPFSNRGGALGLTAPGVGVLSTLPGQLYGQRSGTSMAAPFVAGVAALVWAASPSLTAAEVRERLLASAADRGAPGPDPVYGRGEVDPLAALALR